MAASLPVERLHHLSRGTPDVKRLTDFYIQVLGFKKIARPDLGFDGSWLELGDIQMHIIERNYATNTPETPYCNNGKPRSPPNALRQSHHSAFLTNNIDVVMKKLKEFGIKYYTKPLTKESTRTQCWFYDPDGNGIEIIQPFVTEKARSKL